MLDELAGRNPLLINHPTELRKNKEYCLQKAYTFFSTHHQFSKIGENNGFQFQPILYIDAVLLQSLYQPGVHSAVCWFYSYLAILCLSVCLSRGNVASTVLFVLVTAVSLSLG